MSIAVTRPISLPFIVLDQNCCRDEAMIDALFRRCDRENLKILLPDTAIYEFSKGDNPYLTWRRSLEYLSRRPDLVVAGRSLGLAMKQELRTGEPIAEIVDERVTPWLRTLLTELANGNDEQINYALGMIADIIEPEKKLRGDHNRNKATATTLRDHWKETLSGEDLKALRNQDSEAYSRILSEIKTASKIVQAARNDGCTTEVACGLAMNPSVYSHQIFSLLAVALDWLSQGGLDAADPDKCTNDFLDIDYICSALFCTDLASKDKRAMRVFRGLKDAFAKRWEQIDSTPDEAEDAKV